MTRILVLVLAASSLLFTLAAAAGPASLTSSGNSQSMNNLRIDELQYIGTHNSYKRVPPHPAVLAAMKQLEPGATDEQLKGAWWQTLVGLLPSVLGITQQEAVVVAMGLEYSHGSLVSQLQLGVRAFELDVYRDNEPYLGIPNRYGLYPSLIVPKPPYTGSNFDFTVTQDASKVGNGLKVFHIPGLDQESTCNSLSQCLRPMRAWSARNRRHLPIMIQIEAKRSGIPGFPPPVLDWSASDLALIDQEIRSVLSADYLITPKDVTQPNKTLTQSLSECGWPTLREARGRFLFFMDADADLLQAYNTLNPPQGRVLFVAPNSVTGSSDTAFAIINDPSSAAINTAASANYLVRTRTEDLDTLNGRVGYDVDSLVRATAFGSAANILSTDFEVSPASSATVLPGVFLPFNPAYNVTFPNVLKYARCHPIRARRFCRNNALSELDGSVALSDDDDDDDDDDEPSGSGHCRRPRAPRTDSSETSDEAATTDESTSVGVHVSPAGIAGVIVGGAVLLALVLAFVVYRVRKSRIHRTQQAQTSVSLEEMVSVETSQSA